MTEKPPKICPHCGQSQHEDQARKISANAKEEPREYDHRGVLMPKRTRIGGIIIPQ